MKLLCTGDEKRPADVLRREACDFLFREQGIDFSLLAPLMEETLRKAEANPPFAVQTGPAARGDAAVLARQEALLASSETGRAYLEVYRLLAKAVQERAGKKI